MTDMEHPESEVQYKAGKFDLVNMESPKNKSIFMQKAYIDNMREARKNDRDFVEFLENFEKRKILQLGRLEPQSFEAKQINQQLKETHDLQQEIGNKKFGVDKYKSYVEELDFYSKLHKEQIMYRNPKEQTYMPNDGFTAVFDKLVGLPLNCTNLKLYYDVSVKGFFNRPDRQTMNLQCQQYSYKENWCDLNQKDIFPGVNNDQSLVIYIQIYAEFTVQQRQYTAPVSKVIGWTMVEIFRQKKLQCGYFKLPVYSSKLSPETFMKSGLPSIQGANLYMRLGFNNDNNMQIKMTNQFEYLYNIPEFHLRPYHKMGDNKFHIHFISWDLGGEVFVEELDNFMQRNRIEQIQEIKKTLNREYQPLAESVNIDDKRDKRVLQNRQNVFSYIPPVANQNGITDKLNQKLISQWYSNYEEGVNPPVIFKEVQIPVYIPEREKFNPKNKHSKVPNRSELYKHNQSKNMKNNNVFKSKPLDHNKKREIINQFISQDKDDPIETLSISNGFEKKSSKYKRNIKKQQQSQQPSNYSQSQISSQQSYEQEG